MTYEPKPFTTTSTAIRVVEYNSNRRYVAIHNLSGETCYHGKSSAVTINNGMPIFNNDLMEFSEYNGNDPRLERWIVGSTGGNIRVMEE